MPTLATREIGIDMGHRVPAHESKCRNLHGHRYTVQVTIAGELIPSGASEGMVLDFGFMKDEMMAEIDAPCDHGTCLWVKDDLLEEFFSPTEIELMCQLVRNSPHGGVEHTWPGGKLYLLDRVPTAENLAGHWARRLTPRIDVRSAMQAHVARVRVWETPNCYADYVPPALEGVR